MLVSCSKSPGSIDRADLHVAFVYFELKVLLLSSLVIANRQFFSKTSHFTVRLLLLRPLSLVFTDVN